MAVLLTLLGLAAVSSAQMLGTTAEKNPAFTFKQCTSAGCTARNTFLTLDLFSRNVVSKTDPTKSCVTQSIADLQAICNTTEACASTCQVQGADYPAAGVLMGSPPTSFGLQVFGKNASGVVAPLLPRVYILDESGEKYLLFKLGSEISFDVDLSTVPCGSVANVIATSMDPTGAKNALNPGGAKYGAGHCDGGCRTDQTFTNFGMANLNASGNCCAQMDIFNSNSRAEQDAVHPCAMVGPALCSDADGTCKYQANQMCDPSGCGGKPYRLGVKTFFGRGKDFAVDSTRPFTVVSQYLAGPGGTWGGMKRMYIQDGKMINNFAENGTTTPVVVTPDFCQRRMGDWRNGTVYGNFTKYGGLDQVAKSLAQGMVLQFDIRAGDGISSWLDAGDAGPCNATTDDTVAAILATNPDATVNFSDVRIGDVGTTYTDKIKTSAQDAYSFF